MKLIACDENRENLTISIKNEEFIYIAGVLSGVLSTFSHQDPLILGIDQETLRDLNTQMHDITHALNESRGYRGRK